jgi:hypothetical protein
MGFNYDKPPTPEDQRREQHETPEGMREWDPNEGPENHPDGPVNPGDPENRQEGPQKEGDPDPIGHPEGPEGQGGPQQPGDPENRPDGPRQPGDPEKGPERRRY